MRVSFRGAPPAFPGKWDLQNPEWASLTTCCVRVRIGCTPPYPGGAEMKGDRFLFGGANSGSPSEDSSPAAFGAGQKTPQIARDWREQRVSAAYA